MHVGFFFKGLLTGIAVGVPIGPIGILCLQRTLSKGREYGLVSGLGGATADALIGLIAASGLLYIQDVLLDYQDWLQFAGGALLCILGCRTFFSHPHGPKRPINGIGLLRAYTSVFFLTLTNPLILLWTIGLLVSLKVASTHGHPVHATLLMAGVFTGSATWWVILAAGLGWLRARSDHSVLIWVNRIGGIVLASFGMLLFMKVIF